MDRPLVIAHRGASWDAPESTMAAFRLAWEEGADAIETDLRLTADGKIVTFHDADGRRTLGDPRLIRDMSLAELRLLDAGRWKSPRWSGERVPMLRELLEITPPDRQLVLELKEDLVAELARALRDAPRHRITLIAFHTGIIAKAKAHLPDCRALWLFNDYRSFPARERSAWLERRIRELGVDGVDLQDGLFLNRRLVEPLRAKGHMIFVYTVNYSPMARRCAGLGLDGITTDRPGDLRRWLGIST